MRQSLRVSLIRLTFSLLCASAFILVAGTLRSQSPPAAQQQSPPATTQTPQSPKTDDIPAQKQAPQPAKPTDNAEVSSHDTPATFKVRVNLVLVRVVARDSAGHVLTNLQKQDFQLFDNRKPQVISSFSVDTANAHAPDSSGSNATTPAVSGDAEASAAVRAAMPKRFVSVVFDDIDMKMEDAVFVRDSATRLFGSLAPSDRVGMYTTSGQFTQEFTDDHELLKKSLLGIVPHPLAGGQGFHDCPDISYYEADQIQNFQNTQALAVATEDAVQCAFNGDERQRTAAQALAQSGAAREAALGDSQTAFVYSHLHDAIRRLSSMPGQRIMVFVSPGFLLTAITRQSGDLTDRANRANIVINTIDARGLYTPDMGDISDPSHGSPITAGVKGSYALAAQSAQADILAELADGTGGTFFHNRNDVDEGMREAVAAPPVSYLLGFSPQNLKLDGRFHTLKVTLANKQKATLQARHGYYAPRTIPDPAEAAKQEIQEALFSQEEIQDIPVDLQTQFFKADVTKARLAVLTHVDVKGIHFRKADGRNRDNLTVATAIFDQNGNYVTGGEKVIEMRLLDTTFDRLSHSGFTVKSSFDVKPGTYMVRLVVRDGEGTQMAARNGAVVIPN